MNDADALLAQDAAQTCDLVDEIVEDEIAKLEGPECSPGEHVPFDLDDKLVAHCDRCERSLHRATPEAVWVANHFGGCRCVTCFPERQARGYAAKTRVHSDASSRTTRIFPVEGYVATLGAWIFFSDSDGRAILGQVFNVRRDGKFVDVLVPSARTMAPTSIHRRYVLRAAATSELG